MDFSNNNVSQFHKVISMGPNYCTPARSQVEKKKKERNIWNCNGFIVWLRKKKKGRRWGEQII